MSLYEYVNHVPAQLKYEQLFTVENCHILGLKWIGIKYYNNMLHYRYRVIDDKCWFATCLKYGIQVDTDPR